MLEDLVNEMPSWDVHDSAHDARERTKALIRELINRELRHPEYGELMCKDPTFMGNAQAYSGLPYFRDKRFCPKRNRFVRYTPDDMIMAHPTQGPTYTFYLDGRKLDSRNHVLPVWRLWVFKANKILAMTTNDPYNIQWSECRSDTAAQRNIDTLTNWCRWQRRIYELNLLRKHR